MVSLKSTSRTSYRVSIGTIAVNCLVFEKIAFYVRIFGDRQTDPSRTNRQTDGQPSALSRKLASGGLKQEKQRNILCVASE